MPAPLLLAFDLGATRLKAGLVEVPSGVVERFTVVPTAGADADEALDATRTAAKELLDGLDVRPAHVALSTPGVVEDGRITSLPGKFEGIVGRDLAGFLRTTFDAPALVVNDAVAYAHGEAGVGAGAGARRVLVVTIGTGIGVCVLDDGVLRGSGPYAGGTLGGHLPISDETGPLDTNGRRGTFEARCAAQRITDAVRDAGGDAVDVAAAYAAYHAGDAASRSGIAAYRGWLARGLVALAHAHTPEVIVLGGGPVVDDAPILDGLADAVNGRLWSGYTVAIRPAALGDTASLAGLARLCAGRPA